MRRDSAIDIVGAGRVEVRRANVGTPPRPPGNDDLCSDLTAADNTSGRANTPKRPATVDLKDVRPDDVGPEHTPNRPGSSPRISLREGDNDGDEARHDECVPHVLLLLPNDGYRGTLLEALGKDVSVTVFDLFDAELFEERRRAALPPFDVAVTRADHLGLAGGALLYDPKVGSPEVVFVVDEPWSPQRFALQSRGFRYAVPKDVLVEWLPAVLPQLSQMARARRFVLTTHANAPAAPELPAPCAQLPAMSLYTAETNFRGTFLRLLLAEHGSRRRAAEAAGIPYRSFCEMLRRLGI